MSKIDPQLRLSAPKVQIFFFAYLSKFLYFWEKIKRRHFSYFEYLSKNSPKLNQNYYWLWVYLGLSVSNGQIPIAVLNYTVTWKYIWWYNFTYFLRHLRTGKCRTLKVRFCHLSTETPINKATQFFQKVNKIFRKNPARSGLQTVQSVREKTWVKWGWRLKNRLKSLQKLCKQSLWDEKNRQKTCQIELVIWIFKIWATMDVVHQRLKYGFCNESFRKKERLTRWTLFSTYLSSNYQLDSPSPIFW